MKKIFFFIIIAGSLALLPLSLHGQCKSFANKICKAELTPYIHDGNFHAAILSVGEEAELYKTFYSGQEYRIAICGSDMMPNIEFRVYDSNRKLVYTNRDDDYKNTWDFTLDASQQLKIWVKVLDPGEKKTEMMSGCVAIMFGFKNK
jgi:hypothetical protein